MLNWIRFATRKNGMRGKLKVLGINGSASQSSSNLAILHAVAKLGKPHFDLEIIDDLSKLPHFRTELTDDNIPEELIKLRNQIEVADGVIVCTPEYVFSIPSRLKNAIEWCVSTTVFSDKPTGLITASAQGEKGHEELKLILQTVQASLAEDATLLISGVRGKVNKNGDIADHEIATAVKKLVEAFAELMGEK
ncbi:NADPH-dependent FMN reductase [Tunicatimonas pelagia]|uniref:NADPH-dependent FMN reductase n=1 Tax=Tunicatimonas pelagia TaxID=931531 RepID=UPI002665252B|nr:NADPH-dependent FMN reductase [Tunicatimonas pelagia]WKN45773.1 NAD(P)H-dependent oxidoreductase [Tunicatimonas pelagia]